MIDPLLLHLVQSVERSNPGGATVTLVVGGRIISGWLVPERVWLEYYFLQIAQGASTESAEAAARQVAGEIEGLVPDERKVSHFHLLNALVLGAEQAFGQALSVRGRLEDVSMWWLGAPQSSIPSSVIPPTP